MSPHQAGTHARTSWPLAVLLLSVLAGLVFVAGAVTSRGSDIRPAGGDIRTLVQDRTRSVAGQREEAADLRADIDELSESVADHSLRTLNRRIDSLEARGGLAASRGPGLRVILDDAPPEASAEGLDPNIFVVHQQDLQAFVNAIWAGGAEAVALQGQRLVSTTGIKCVGSTVVLDGVPYSPPYVIEAIGPTSQMEQALNESRAVSNYRAYVRRYGLGLKIEAAGQLELAGYTGPVNLRSAEIAD